MDAICLVCESAFGVEGFTTTAQQLECPNCQMGILLFDEDESSSSSDQLFTSTLVELDSEGAAILSIPTPTPAPQDEPPSSSSIETRPPRSHPQTIKVVDAFSSAHPAEADPLSPISETLHAPEDLTRTLPNMWAIKGAPPTEQPLDSPTSTKEQPTDTQETTPVPDTKQHEQGLASDLLSNEQDTIDNEAFNTAKHNSTDLDLALSLSTQIDDILLTTLPLSTTEPETLETEEEAEVVLATIPNLLSESELELDPEPEPEPAQAKEPEPEPAQAKEPEPEPVVEEVVSKGKPTDPTLDLLATQLDSALTSSLLSDPLFTSTEQQEPKASQEEKQSTQAESEETQKKPVPTEVATIPIEALPEIESDPGEISIVEALTQVDLLPEEEDSASAASTEALSASDILLSQEGTNTASTETLSASDILLSQEAIPEAKPETEVPPTTKEAAKPPPIPTSDSDDALDEMELELAIPEMASKEILAAASGEFEAQANISLKPETDPNKQTLPFVSKETIRKFVEQNEVEATEEETAEPPKKKVGPPPPPKKQAEPPTQEATVEPPTKDPTEVLSEPPMVDFDAFSQEFFEADVKEPGTEHEAELIALLQQQREENRRIIQRIAIFVPLLLLVTVGMFWSINHWMGRKKQTDDNTNKAWATKQAPAQRREALALRRLPPTPPLAKAPKKRGSTTLTDGGATTLTKRPIPTADRHPAPRVVTRQPAPSRISQAKLKKQRLAAKARQQAEKKRLLAEKKAKEKRQRAAKLAARKAKLAARKAKRAARKAKRAARRAARKAKRAARRAARKAKRAARRAARKAKRAARRKKRQRAAKRRAAKRKKRQRAAKRRAAKRKKRRRVARVSKKSKRDPAAAKKYYKRGMRAFLGGKLKRAERELKRAIRANPKLADAHRVLGMTYMRMQKKRKAKRHLKSFLRLAPGHPIAGMIKNLVKSL